MTQPLLNPVKSTKYRMTVVFGCIVCTALVGLLDYATGLDLRIYPLYYLPIAVGAFRVSRYFGLGLALMSSGLWVTAMHLAGSAWGIETYLFNTLTQTISFAVIAILLSNIAARLAAERALSRKDDLTSLPNSRAFYEYAEILLAGAGRSKRPLTLAYIDLDNFKEVNDKHGHRQGDLALREAAGVFQRSLRESDLAARLGGDEFALLLMDTDSEGAKTVLDRISKLLLETMRQHQWPISASIGAISFHQAPDTIEQAVHAADALMYRVKAMGKGQVLVEVVG